MGKKPFRETHGAVGTFHSFRPLQLCSEIGEGEEVEREAEEEGRAVVG